ncbi:MAG: L,D-transpeptidase/peptidoglycan binding protein [Coriobacteriia bacterium]
MDRAHSSLRILAVIGAVLVMSLSMGSAWAVVDDYTRRDVAPLGVTVEGHDVGGLQRIAVRDVIEDTVARPYLEPLAATYRGRTFVLPAADYVRVDVDGMIGEALAPQTGASIARRLYLRVTGRPVTTDVAIRVSADETALRRWVTETASAIDTRAVDATLTMNGDRLVVKRDRLGHRVRVDDSVTVLSDALEHGVKTVELRADLITASVEASSFGQTLLVRKSERRVYLYDVDRMVKSYPCAIGTPGWPTPNGWFRIVNKRKNPSWSNPHSSWATGMPDYIPPGPGNPLGTRALDLSAAGIRIHGTTKDWSIGQAASHGCMRMHRWDIEDLFDRVRVGARVIIVR